jgi:hypothetical protein
MVDDVHPTIERIPIERVYDLFFADAGERHAGIYDRRESKMKHPRSLSFDAPHA